MDRLPTTVDELQKFIDRFKTRYGPQHRVTYWQVTKECMEDCKSKLGSDLRLEKRPVNGPATIPAAIHFKHHNDWVRLIPTHPEIKEVPRLPQLSDIPVEELVKDMYNPDIKYTASCICSMNQIMRNGCSCGGT